MMHIAEEYRSRMVIGIYKLCVKFAGEERKQSFSASGHFVFDR